MKKTSKKSEIKYTVNLNNIETLKDIYSEWACAKHDAGLALTDDELIDIIDSVIDDMCMNCVHCATLIIDTQKKKFPWYKRFWKWLRRK